jgi:hypothetical protein
MAGAHRDVGSFTRERKRDAASDSITAARYQGGTTFQFHGSVG